MSDSVSVARQATFNTEPGGTGTSSGRGIRRGELKIPVIEGVVAPDNENHRPSLASSSGHSSPIYANGDANLKKYRLDALNNSNSRAANRQNKAPPSYSESDLEILSDVGLAGDSDTEGPPSLSISARKKLRKEPRIKVPSSKFDSTEAPIQEEPTQELLVHPSPETDTDNLYGTTGNSRRRSNISDGSPKRKKSVSFDNNPQTVNITPREEIYENRKRQGLSPTAREKEIKAREKIRAKKQRSPDFLDVYDPRNRLSPSGTANKLTSTDADKRGVNLNPDPIEPELDDLDSDFWKPVIRNRKDRPDLSKSRDKGNKQGRKNSPDLSKSRDKDNKQVRKTSPENKVNGTRANSRNPQDNLRGKQKDPKEDQNQPRRHLNGDNKDNNSRHKEDINSPKHNVNGKNRDSPDSSKDNKNLPKQTVKEDNKGREPNSDSKKESVHNSPKSRDSNSDSKRESVQNSLKGKEPNSDSKRGGVNNSPKDDRNSTTTDKDKNKRRDEVSSSRSPNKNPKVNSPQGPKTEDLDKTLDSSFCESDWQPRNQNTKEIPEHSKRPTKDKNQSNKTASNGETGTGKQTLGKNTTQQQRVNGDSNATSRESVKESEEKKENTSSLKKGETQDKTKTDNEKGELSTRSQTYLKGEEPGSKGDHYQKDTRERSKESLTNSQKLVEEDKKEISNEYKTKVNHEQNSRIEDKENDPYRTNEAISESEKLKTSSSKNDPRLQSESIASNSEKLNSSHKQKLDSNTQQGQKSKSGDSSSQGTPPTTAARNMATSDGYDYESETFEEVLKERNAMVKTERTYQRRIKQLEDELKGMVHECQKLSDENKELRQTLDDPQISSNTDPKNKDADSVDMATRIAKLETEKENLEKSNETLASKLKENDTKMKQWDTVFLENTRLKNKKAELDKKVQELDKELGYVSDRMKNSDTDKESRIQSASKKSKELEDKLINAQYENKTLKDKVKSLETDKAAVSTALEDKRTELNEVMKAMQNETTTESELKESKAKLDKAQSEVNSVKQELEDLKKLLKTSEESKEKLQGSLAQKDNEVKKMKGEQENKDKVIGELRNSVDRSKQEIQKYEQEKDMVKDAEKETLALKSRIGSLKAEIESSINENQKLKQDREAMTYELDRLRQENMSTADAVIDSKKYFRKWETEKEFRNKAESELARKDEEVKILDTRVKEAGNRINVLHGRIKVLEDEKAHLLDLDLQTIENNNRILTDENAKLRKMLVERNIELTNKSTEQLAIDSRIQLLERKHQDAEVRARQLSGWVGNLEQDGPSDNNFKPSTTAASNKRNFQLRPHNNGHPKNPTRSSNDQLHSHRAQNGKLRNQGEHQIAYVSPRSNKMAGKRNPRSTMTPPLGWDKPSANYIDGSGANHTPTSLPSIFDAKSMTPPDPHGGYFSLYKEKLKRMKERKF